MNLCSTVACSMLFGSSHQKFSIQSNLFSKPGQFLKNSQDIQCFILSNSSLYVLFKVVKNAMETQNAISGIFYFVSHFFKILYWYLEAMYRFVVPPSMKYIDGEVILITGATGGIGSEICRYIVKCGYDIKLILWDLNMNELNKLAEELNSTGSHGLTVFCYEVDISDRENIDKCCTLVSRFFLNLEEK